MRRPSLHPLWLLLLFAGCPMGQPTLELSVAGTGRVDSDISVGVTATAADGTPGQGSVALSTSLGTLGASTLTLADGSGRTTLKCARSLAGCVAGATINVTARWTIPGGTVVTQMATLRLTDPMASDAGVPDAGSRVDAGTDGGFDAGLPEVDAGYPPLDGTPVTGFGDALLLGHLGAPRTVGFSPVLGADNPLLLGFDGLPEHAVFFSGRLAYVRDGYAWLWREDFPDGGPPMVPDAGDVDAGEPDAGDVDGGEVDGGDLDAGAVDAGAADAGGRDGGAPDAGRDGGFDAGPDTRPFPPGSLEANDVLLTDCLNFFGQPDAGFVRTLVPTPSGGLWVGCTPTRDGGIDLYRKGDLFLTAAVNFEPAAANDTQLLGLVSDSGIYVLSQTQTLSPSSIPVRQFSPGSVRAVSGGFELIGHDDVSGHCVLAFIDGQTAAFSEFALPAAFPTDVSCLAGRFLGRQDVVLYPVSGTLTDGVRAIAFSRPVPVPDGGADGGVDAGVRDAGAPASPFDGGLVFRAGPPSDFSAVPPVWSIDFGQSVQLVTRP